MQRTETGELASGNYWHADASAWCCCARCKIHEELADAKAENDALRDDVAAGRHRFIKAVCQSVREATTASGVDNAAPRLAGHRWLGLFHPQGERLITMQKQLEGTRSILMSSADGCPYRWATHAIIVSNTHALPANCQMPKVIKPEQSIYECCWVSVSTTFSAPPQILAASTVFFCPIPETKKWWVMVSFGATAAGLFWTVNVCWAHPVISRASAMAVAFFSWCYSRCFWFAESYV